MSSVKPIKWIVAAGIALSVAGCSGGIFGGGKRGQPDHDNKFVPSYDSAARQNRATNGSSILDLFNNNADPNVTLRVNKYLWTASLDVLNFMPVQAADPFTGTISMGYGRPQGGGAAYRATVYITDPALDARSLRVALQGANGRAVSTQTVRAVEDAILTRARQIRVRDTKL